MASRSDMLSKAKASGNQEKRKDLSMLLQQAESFELVAAENYASNLSWTKIQESDNSNIKQSAFFST